MTISRSREFYTDFLCHAISRDVRRVSLTVRKKFHSSCKCRRRVDVKCHVNRLFGLPLRNKVLETVAATTDPGCARVKRADGASRTITGSRKPMDA